MAIPTLIAYFIYKTKFGTIVAEVNRVAGEMVFTLVRAARGGFEEGEAEGGEYYEDPRSAPGALRCPRLILLSVSQPLAKRFQREHERV